MLRITKIILVALVAVWAFLGAAFNILHWGETVGAVRATATMATFDGGAENWRATSSPVVIWLGAMLIPALKTTAGLCCLIGAGRMWAARKDDAPTFAAAKTLALSGCAIAMILLFGGWIVIAETWFELWRSDALRDVALQSAFRYGAMIMLIALFVGARED